MRTHLIMSALAAAVVLSTSAISQASVVYEETFGYYNTTNPSTGQVKFSNYDWDAQNGGATPKDIGGTLPNTAGTDIGGVSIGGPNGNHVGHTGPNGGTSTLIGTQAQSTSAGPVFFSNGTPSAANQTTSYNYGVAYNVITDAPTLDYTKEYATYGSDALNSVNHPGLTFSWFEANNNANGGYSLAVEVGNQWYVSATVYANEFANQGGLSGTTQMATNGYENNFVYDGTQSFNLLNFNGDYTFGAGLYGVGDTFTTTTVLSRDTIDPTVTLDPTLTIQAFGLFSDTVVTTGNRRFDAFTITDNLVATPEPASLALIGIGSLLMLRRRRSI